MKNNYTNIVLSVIAVCLILITFKLFTLSILDTVPSMSEMQSMYKGENQRKAEKLTILYSIIGKGVEKADSLKVEIDEPVQVDGEVRCY